MSTNPSPIRLPDVPVLAAGLTGAALAFPDGEIRALSLKDAAREARSLEPMLCHGPAVAVRLGIDPFPAYDLLELFAFVRPAKFCIPTPRGLAAQLGFKRPAALEDEALALVEAAARLLRELAKLQDRAGQDARTVARTMTEAGWNWGPSVAAALGLETGRGQSLGLKIWERLPEWSEIAPDPPPGNIPVDPAEARQRLAELLGADAEARPAQADYASAASRAFLPRRRADEPELVLAEAGTGTGKTLGYIAPASLWAEKNQGPVWISTFTRNLQRQLDVELDRLITDPEEKRRRVVIRKGRENYFCLLNFEEAAARLANRAETRPGEAALLGLLARWALASRDGDMVGGDLPGWLPELMGRTRTMELADRRGECVYSACQHFHKCFIERTVRRARRAQIVIANHALVMVQAALGGLDDGTLPQRLVFDEGHHLFDAADAAFSAFLSAAETADLRRWILGAEEGRSRARGLERRIGDLAEGREEIAAALRDALVAARALPGPAWAARLAGENPHGPAEKFFALVRRQVFARAEHEHSPYGLETDLLPPLEGLAEAARELGAALAKLERPLADLAKALLKMLAAEAADLDPSTRQRIEAIARSLDRRASQSLKSWRAMLAEISGPANPDYVDWLEIERIEGRDVDVGYRRHWVDPAKPLAEAVYKPAHGVLITSATLRDASGDAEADWRAAERQTGAAHLPNPALRAAFPSPFDYGARTRVFVVNDLRHDDMDAVAAAYRELFLAAGGGGLGLFTAINRLKAVHHRIAQPLDGAGLTLLAQHVDGMDVTTLLEIFRAEEDACLLGTDAVRDGVDVPGRSLRLIVLERVPWTRPTILQRARRDAFGKAAYEDWLTRKRLRQAFGRLIRRAGDAGVFVLLDRRMPSRLLSAFPEGVQPERLGLAEAIRKTREFLSSSLSTG